MTERFPMGDHEGHELPEPDLDFDDVRQALAYAAALAQDELHPLRAFARAVRSADRSKKPGSGSV